MIQLGSLWGRLHSRGRGFSSGARLDRKALERYGTERIRNFCILAHIDHGKSTLADRMLELTGTKLSGKEQVLDTLEVERERGITVRAQTATMRYESEGSDCLLNLIDTPGHVDFGYQVDRSLRACQGALLLVDATKGVQAQTVANLHKAMEAVSRVIAGAQHHPSNQ